MTEQELISKLQELRQIKPNASWVSLSKMNILGGGMVNENTVPKSAAKWNFSNIFGMFSQRKFAYALASLLFVFAGVAGVLKYQTLSPMKFVVKSQADIVAENTLKSHVEDLKNKSQNLADLIESKSENTSVAVQAVKEAAKSVTDSIKKDPGLAKVIALDVNNSRTILDIPGGGAEVKATSDDIYKTIDDPIIASIKETKLTPDQQMAFDNILSLYDKGDYSDVLVRLLISFGKNDAESK